MRRIDFLFKHVQEGNILDVGNLDLKSHIHEALLEKLPHSTINGIDTEDQASFGKSFAHQTRDNAEKMPYESNTFDTVYLGEVLEHTWVPRQLAEECFRILKPGGIFIMDTPNVYALGRMLRYSITGRDVILGQPDHKIFFSRAMIENMYEKIGFEIVELTTDYRVTLKGKSFHLPNVGPFTYMGEHLMVAARKPSHGQ